jgi:large subunit ribosomal protein L8e
MGRVIRAQRRGALGSCFNAATTHKKGVAKLRKFDYAEKNGFVKGVITQIAHDPGRGAPVMKVKFRDPYRNKAVFETMVAPEGVYGGQFIFSGLKSKMAVGNILPVGQMVEGAFPHPRPLDARTPPLPPSPRPPPFTPLPHLTTL